MARSFFRWKRFAVEELRRVDLDRPDLPADRVVEDERRSVCDHHRSGKPGEIDLLDGHVPIGSGQQERADLLSHGVRIEKARE